MGRKHTNNQPVPLDADKQVYYYFYLNLSTGITCWGCVTSDRLIIVFSRCLDADQHSYLVPQPDMPPNIHGKKRVNNQPAVTLHPRNLSAAVSSTSTHRLNIISFFLCHMAAQNTALEKSTIKKIVVPYRKMHVTGKIKTNQPATTQHALQPQCSQHHGHEG